MVVIAALDRDVGIVVDQVVRVEIHDRKVMSIDVADDVVKGGRVDVVRGGGEGLSNDPFCASGKQLPEQSEDAELLKPCL